MAPSTTPSNPTLIWETYSGSYYRHQELPPFLNHFKLLPMLAWARMDARSPPLFHKDTTNKPRSTSPSTSSDKKLSQQYGGRHTANWVERLPESWIPYVQLARLSPPVSVCLVLFPHVFGFLHGTLLLESAEPSSSRFSKDPQVANTDSSHRHHTASQLIQPAVLLIMGSFFMSNAVHAWNDLIDAPYDALVARTRERPVARGAVSKLGALLFTISQGAASVALLAIMLPNLDDWTLVVWPGVLMDTYYPWAKRQTHLAQYVLGLCLAWGVVVGTAGVLEAAEPGRGGAVWTGTTGTSTACLTAAALLWTVIYDTIYAFQDREDDVRVGLKSTAVLLGAWTKRFLVVNLVGMLGLLAYLGAVLELGLLYYAFAVGGTLLSLGIMVMKVDLRDPSNCWWWFRNGFWFAGGSLAMGLLLECDLLASNLPNRR